MLNPDLSFTNNSQWLEQRQQLWRQVEEQLKPNFRKKELEVIEAYMMTGIVDEKSPLPDSALLNYFPLMEATGWDYVYQSLVKKPNLFEYEFYYSTHGNMNTQVTEEEKLRYFDYYHPEVYSPIVKSRVPICGEYLEVNVDPIKLFNFMASMLIQMIEKDRFSICFYRKEYFFSVMLICDFDGSDSESQRASRLLKRFMKNACKFQPKIEPVDNTKHIQFLSDVRDQLESNTQNASINEVWLKVKEEQGVQ